MRASVLFPLEYSTNVASPARGSKRRLLVAKSGRSPVKNIDSPVTLSKQLPAGTTIMPNTQLSFYYNNPSAELNVLDQLWPE